MNIVEMEELSLQVGSLLEPDLAERFGTSAYLYVDTVACTEIMIRMLWSKGITICGNDFFVYAKAFTEYAEEDLIDYWYDVFLPIPEIMVLVDNDARLAFRLTILKTVVRLYGN